MAPDLFCRSRKGYPKSPAQVLAMPLRLHCGVLALLVSMTISETIPPLAAGVVNPCTDASLRAALAGGGIVTFECDGTIIVTNTITIDQDSVLDGSGHAVAISGDKRFRIFQVNTGVTFTAKALTIANGSNQGPAGAGGVPAGGGFGAGILNLAGTLNLNS